MSNANHTDNEPKTTEASSFHISIQIKRKLQELAKRSGVNYSEYCRMVLSEAAREEPEFEVSYKRVVKTEEQK